MSKSTETEIKELIGTLDRKLDFLTQEVSSIKQEVSSIKTAIEKMDNRLWAFGGLILAACLGALLKALNL